MRSILSALIVFGMVLAACAGGIVAPASAASFDEKVSGASVQGESSTQSENWVAGGIFSVRKGLSLGKGKVSHSERVAVFKLFDDEKEQRWGMRVEWAPNTYNVSAKASYQVFRMGEATWYWIQTTISTTTIPSLASATCEVFAGEPGKAGSEKPVWNSPLQCETFRNGYDNDFEFKVDYARAL